MTAPTTALLPRLLQFFRRVLRLPASPNRGGLGEQLAAEWLVRERGFSIVTRNWRNPQDRREEIDLVCRDGSILVFIEVKARAADALVPGYYAVDRRKRRVLHRAIRTYLAQLQVKPHTFRFDIVEVALPAVRATGTAANTRSAQPQILHFQNVILFSKHFRA